MATPFNLFDIQIMRPKHFIPKEDLTPTPPIIHTESTLEIPPNALAQRRNKNG